MARITKERAFARDPQNAKAAKRIGNNTWRYPVEGGEAIRLHRTDIVTLYQSGVTILDSGGYRSVTTKERMNCYSPYRVYSDKGNWFVSDGSRVAPFYDGMKLPAAFDKPKVSEVEQHAALRQEIAHFARLVLTVETVPLPDAGDCWYCSMFQAMPPRDAKRMEYRQPGERLDGDMEHLREHIREKYLHGSLIVNALRWAGYGDVGIGLYFQHSDQWARKIMQRALRRFLSRQLGISF